MYHIQRARQVLKLHAHLPVHGGRQDQLRRQRPCQHDCCDMAIQLVHEACDTILEYAVLETHLALPVYLNAQSSPASNCGKGLTSIHPVQHY